MPKRMIEGEPWENIGSIVPRGKAVVLGGAAGQRPVSNLSKVFLVFVEANYSFPPIRAENLDHRESRKPSVEAFSQYRTVSSIDRSGRCGLFFLKN